MSTEHENTGRSSFELIRLHFKSIKVVISNAIRKPFPFLEVLRDTDLITNKMYEDFRDSCTNLVPVQEVAYRALEELEKRLDLQVLRVLFCMESMEAYPDLKHAFKSFQNVLPQNELWSEEIDRRDQNSQLSLEQGPGDSCSQESLTWSPSGPSSSDGWRSGRNTTLIQGNQTENHQFSIPQIHNESCELEVQPSDRNARLEPHIPLPCSKEKSFYVAQATLELKIPPVLAFKVLGLQSSAVRILLMKIAAQRNPPQSSASQILPILRAPAPGKDKEGQDEYTVAPLLN